MSVYRDRSARPLRPCRAAPDAPKSTQTDRTGGKEHAAPADQVADHAGSEAPSRLPLMVAARMRPIAHPTLRYRTRSPTNAKAIGNTPLPAAPGDVYGTSSAFKISSPARRVAWRHLNDHAGKWMSRVLLNMSASAPSTPAGISAARAAGRQQGQQSSSTDNRRWSNLRNDGSIASGGTTKSRSHDQRHQIKRTTHKNLLAPDQRRLAETGGQPSRTRSDVRNSGSISFSGTMLGPSDGA